MLSTTQHGAAATMAHQASTARTASVLQMSWFPGEVNASIVSCCSVILLIQACDVKSTSVNDSTDQVSLKMFQRCSNRCEVDTLLTVSFVVFDAECFDVDDAVVVVVL